MRRQVNHVRAITTIERTTVQTTDAWTRLEVQGEIVATGIVVSSLGMPRERPTGRRPKLAEQHKKRSTETSLDENSGETGEGNGFGSMSLARARSPSSGSHERTRSAMGKSASLELAIRRKLPSFFRSGHGLTYRSTVAQRVSTDSSMTDRIAIP
ncbi:hypothetical protein AUI06_11735 [archaeon 13_2_20CM_2_52_21]|nr:MAG: hypothetical protein AUI06_11735 [archaeon 13_2_20CM_2_52_21]